MKIVIPIEFYRKGGVERVIISLIPSLLTYTEKIVLILPRNEIDRFRSLLPASEKLVYEDFSFYPGSLQTRELSFYNLLASLYGRLGLDAVQKLFRRRIERIRIEARVEQVIRFHGADRCLYAIINRVPPPRVSVPLSGIAYDLFWRFAPLTYSESYREAYDEPLKEWLDKADLVFTISRKTRDDILKVFPGATYASKLKAVPLAGSVPSFSPGSEAIAPETITFYYPSSFGIYKDHLTLIEAAIELARKGLKFKVILIGEATDSLVSGNVRLSQQFKTREYRDYLEDCNRVYRENREIFEGYFAGLGYRDYETLEANYRTCSCVVFPSRYEGFGLAIAEGIVRGIPVIASDLEVFKEQVELYRCGDRVRFFPMGNAVALAGLLEDFIRNPLPRLSPEGIPARIALRTWDDVAGEYFTFLQDSGR